MPVPRLAVFAVFAAFALSLLLAGAPAKAWYFSTPRQAPRGAQRCGRTYCNLNLRQLDLNHDGHVTLNEFDSDNLPSALFKAIDTNDDGFLSAAEIRAWNLKTRRMQR